MIGIANIGRHLYIMHTYYVISIYYTLELIIQYFFYCHNRYILKTVKRHLYDKIVL